jgi:glycosyltransferase involved in cell wall biosynthesis
VGTAKATRILWLVNIVMPAVAEQMGQVATPFGGWLSVMTDRLAQRPELRIGVAMRAPVASLARIEKNGIIYYAMPQLRTDRFDVDPATVNEVLMDFAPDIVHAEGSEMAYTSRFLRAWTGATLLSMQGIINGFAPFVLGRLPLLSMLNPLRPRVALTALALLVDYRFRFLPRLRQEYDSINLADDLMGRTGWDRAQALAINPKATYHHCSRILRDVFYNTRWAGPDAERHSIFIGSAAAARKGAHVALGALKLLRRQYPDIRLYIAGPRPEDGRGLRRYIGYPVYLMQLIRDLGLEQHIRFTGLLDGEAMAAQMAQSHVYVMSSLIENSPNTLGEAMMIGVPVVCAYSGGAPSMATDESEALFYRAEDSAMLAMQIRRIFESDTLATNLSKAARTRALTTHDANANVEILVGVYKHIMAARTETMR